jgi:hypothetical protein
MKKSVVVTLVLSGALVSGCDDQSQYGNPGYAAGRNVTNDTYVSGLGYYHAPYHGWFEYPYNYYRNGFGYYHGGIYTPQPYVSDVLSSSPIRSPTFGGSGGSSGAHYDSTPSSAGVTRGGFGSIGHGGSPGS